MVEIQALPPEPDGERSIRFHADDDWFGSDGAFEEVVENERIVYTDRWVNFPEAEVDSLVTAEFTDVENGTEVVLTHEQLPKSDFGSGAGMGWEISFDNLAEVLAEARPTSSVARRAITVRRLFDATQERGWRAFTEPEEPISPKSERVGTGTLRR
ncbi:SRPBCC family protein [Saliphagus sp. LR7]|uniref:SRPBCC family protein n=1 Tax=Saliphagus sp. LR7 TaxID=2282654 RepID=UPI000DF72175|nr:SRPBCC family protein [Saliphagus sp. LR7]